MEAVTKGNVSVCVCVCVCEAPLAFSKICRLTLHVVESELVGLQRADGSVSLYEL